MFPRILKKCFVLLCPEFRGAPLSPISGALKLDPTAIAIADIHRLPQRPKFKDGIKVTRPIIVKLVHTKDKNLIHQNLRELKSFNEEKKKSIVNARPVYITDHLPELFLRQKKALLPQFKQARKNKQKVFWRVENGNYVLFINDEKIYAPPTVITN